MAAVEDDYAEPSRKVKQIICFLYTTFGQFPLDLHCYMPFIGAHWRKIPSCRGQAGLLNQWLHMFSHCNSSLHQKEKVQIFVFFFLNLASIRKTDCSHASSRAVIHRTKAHACLLQQRTYHYFICWPSSQSMTLKCNAHPRTVREWVEKAMQGEACNWNASPLHLALIKLRSHTSVKYSNSKGAFLCFTHTAGEAHSIRAHTYIFICITLHSNRSILGDKRENRCGKGHSDIFLMFMH